MLVNIMEAWTIFISAFMIALNDMTPSQFDKKAADTNADGE